MTYTAETIHRSLADRLTRTYGREELRQTVRNVATDLIGTTDPADLPADCRDWVEHAIDDAADTVARAATAQILVELATRLAVAPADLEPCDLMRAISRAQAIHVTEVR